MTQSEKNADGKIEIFQPSGVLFGFISYESEPDLEARIKKAFTHLILLFGGKTDTF